MTRAHCPRERPSRVRGQKLRCGRTSRWWKQKTLRAHFLSWSSRCCSRRNVSIPSATWRSSSIGFQFTSAASVRPCSSCRHRVSPVAYFFSSREKFSRHERNGLSLRRVSASQSARVCRSDRSPQRKTQRVALPRRDRGQKRKLFAFWTAPSAKNASALPSRAVIELKTTNFLRFGRRQARKTPPRCPFAL
jgi:hypothetical protein